MDRQEATSAKSSEFSQAARPSAGIAEIVLSKHGPSGNPMAEVFVAEGTKLKDIQTVEQSIYRELLPRLGLSHCGWPLSPKAATAQSNLLSEKRFCISRPEKYPQPYPQRSSKPAENSRARACVGARRLAHERRDHTRDDEQHAESDDGLQESGTDRTRNDVGEGVAGAGLRARH